MANVNSGKRKIKAMITHKTQKCQSAALLAFAVLATLYALTSAESRGATARIKDIARIADTAETRLIGYGIVLGLNGTGDKDLEITRQTMANLMENFTLSIPVDDIKSKNVAAVMVTATANPFHKEDDKVDVQVSSVGDASSLQGGVLAMTPLLNPAGKVYALAQGSVTIGGYSAGSGGQGGMTQTKNHTTVGIVPQGATLKQSHSPNFAENGIMRLILRHPDFTTANRMVTVINDTIDNIAVAKDASTVLVKVPDPVLKKGRTAAFTAKLESLALTPDVQARIIINERTGTIVMGGNIHIRQAVVAHGNLTVTIKEKLHPSHPRNLILGEGAAPDVESLETPDTRIKVEEEEANVMVVPSTTTVQDLADTLNVMGATPRDMISILEALHKLGAIQMELVVM